MSRRGLSIPSLCVAAALAALAPAAALAAQALPGFPRRVSGAQPGKDPALVSTPVVLDAEGGRAIFGAGNELHCLTFAGAVCEGFPVQLGERSGVVGAPALGDLDAQHKGVVALCQTDGKLTVLGSDGSPVPGFAFQDAAGFEAGPSMLDLDGDGRLEVAFGVKGGKLQALSATGAPVKGFPFTLASTVTSAVAAGRFGAAAPSMTLVTGNEDGKVYAVDLKGASLPGFPVSSSYLVSGEPALGDLDGDGLNDLAFASQDFKVYAIRPDGKAWAGFPAMVGARVLGGPALADLDGDGKLEIAVAAIDGRLHVFDLSGQELKGFPIKLGEKLVGSAVVADLDRDGKDEILVASADGQLHAVRKDGKPAAGFPARLGAEAVGSPAVAEWGDGTVIFQAAGDKVHAFKVKRAGKSTSPLAWREQGHDPARTGRVHPNPPGYADLRIAPAEPSTDDVLAAQYRYFDLDGDPEPATEIRWLRDGKEVPALAGKKSVPKEETKKKEKWRFQVSAPGGAVRQSPEVVIRNSAPGRAKVALDPEVPRRAAAVRAKVVTEAPDADGDKLTYAYTWLRDGKPQKGLAAAELPAGSLKRGERWSVVVTASDGESEGLAASAEATVGDSAPTAPEIALTPAKPKTGDAVKVVVSKPATDVDGDALRYRYRYFVDGVALSLATSLDSLPPLLARKKQVLSVEVQADDGELLGPAAKAQATIVNTAPTAPVPSIVPVEARQKDSLAAGLAAASQDVDGDRLTYRFAFAKAGKTVSEARELAGIKKGETYEMTAVASDGESDSLPGKVTLTVKNTPPTAPALAFEALPLRRSDSIRVKVATPSNDVDGDKVTYRWAWTKNGQPQAGLTAPELPAGTVRKAEVWRVTATPSDGQEDGTAASIEATVADSVPGTLEVALSPAEPRVGDAIKAVISRPATDVDGDKLKYLYRFLVDGTPLPFDSATDSIPARTAKKKQVVTVEVRADDGELQGAVASAKVTVLNTVPEPPKALVLPAGPRNVDALLGGIDQPANDADGDKLTYRFTFTKAGKKVETALADGREVRGLKKGEVYELSVVASDGESEAAPAKASVTVKNTPPTAPAIAFETVPLRRAEAVKVKITVPSTDPDGDAVIYRWAWSKNGQVQAGLASPELPAGTVGKSERWKVTATPNDGQEDGASTSIEAVAADSAPGPLEIALTPAEPRVGDAIKAVVKKPASDPDGDKLKYQYRFFVDGTHLTMDSTIDTVPARTARKKQVVSVEVRADDGEMLGPVATAKVSVLNTAPEAPHAILLPPEPGTLDALLGAVDKPATDADGDKLAYRFTFTKAGKKVEALADGREVRGIKKGEVYQLEVVANDGEVDSPAAQASLTVKNTRPTAPAIAFTNPAPAAGEAVDVKIDRPSTDLDGDAISLSYAWLLDGKPAAGLAKDAKAIPAGKVKKHEVWTVEVTPSDGQENGPSGRARLVAVNTPPTAPVVSIDPAEPTAESGAKARIDQVATDRDGDAIKYRYAWFKDGVRVELPAEAAALKPGTLRRAESLRLVVTPFDGEVEGASAAALARVKDSAPIAPQIALAPEKPTVKDELSCVIKVAAKDADQETPRVSITWKRDGEPVPVSADQLKIAAGVARHGETWSCTAVASDGELSSAAVEAKVIVLNSPPGPLKAVVEPESPQAGQDLFCQLAQPAEDPDGDPVTYAFVWRSGGKVLAADPAEPWKLPASATKKGHAYQCEVTASDGKAKGPAASAEANYRNSAPSAPVVSLAPESPTPGASLTCEIAAPSVDPDGDKVSYRFAWQKNGVDQPFAASSAEVPGRLVKAGDIWRCSVTPSDGDKEGSPGASNEEVVQTASPNAGR
ncbi:MAG TPA: FG-GAP-like repeat-containing protein [Myxococcales bacterium]|jgi:hypothetical protein